MEARDIIIPAAAIVAASGMVTSGASAYDSKLNHTDYWGANCRKVEMPGNVTAYTPSGEHITKVIVKGGTTNKVYDKEPFTGLTAAVNPKSGKVYAISHVIICSDDDEADMPSQPVKHNDNKPVKVEVKTKSTSTATAKPAKAKLSVKHKSKSDHSKNDVTQASKKTDRPASVKTSSISTEGKGGVKAVMGASTDGSVQASELPKTGADDAAVAIVAAGATAYAATRALRRH